MEKDWVKVFATEVRYKAEMAKSLLEEEGIDTILINKRDSLYPFGEIEVYALRQDVLEAINILKKSEI